MSVTNYNDLQAEAIAYSNRSDMVPRLPTFVQMFESDAKVRLKIVDFEESETVTITDGSGTLPADFGGFRAAYWNGDEKRPLRYITPDRFNALDNVVTLPTFYTVIGTTLRVMSQSTGEVVMVYDAKLTSLSESNLTNALITNYPDAYLHGTLEQLYVYTRNTEQASVHNAMKEAAFNRVIKDHKDRKYPGPLEVRVR
jgi:hypothetical protein